LLPVPRFSKAAKEIYYDVLDSFDQTYPGHLTKEEFENLSQIVGEPSVLAQRVINLAELALTSRSVFVIMSFSDDPSLEDAYESFKDVCSAFKPPYDCRRVDEESDVPRILPEILTRISRCAFTIVDLSEE